jgi:hypothetical protein
MSIKGIKPQGKPWTQNEKVYNPAASGRGIKNHNKESLRHIVDPFSFDNDLPGTTELSSDVGRQLIHGCYL